MSTECTVVIQKDEDGYYVRRVPALQGCHTQGTSIDQLLERIQEAVALWLETKFVARIIRRRKPTSPIRD